jgi:tetratricopeptide (TPR) repeat protein
MPPGAVLDDSGATMPPGGADISEATLPPGGEDDSGATVAPSQGQAMKTAISNQGGKTLGAKSQASATQVGLKGSLSATVPTSPSAAKGKLPQVPGYEILGELGRGGMGVVYRARQLGLNRMVALKMVLNSQASESELERFRLEARSVATAQHRNIVGVFDVGEFNGLPYMALEFVEGGPLDNRLKGEPQEPQFTARVMEQVCRAMAHAHSLKIIHRDLKPANVLLTKEDLPKVTDFGLAKELDAEDGHTRTGSIMGTPSYMPPEQAEGKAKELTAVADIYSLGAILYEFLTGRPPFKGRTLLETLEHVRKKDPVAPVDLNPTVPIDLQTIALKALEKDPEKRYQTADEMAEDLAAFGRGDPIKARPITRWQKTVKWARRNKALATLAGVAAAFFLVVLGGSIALNAAYGVAERNRLALQRQVEAARESGRDALQVATAAMAERRFEDARNGLESGLATLAAASSGHEEARGELEDLTAELDKVLVEAKQHLATDKLVGEFNRSHDAALFAHVNQVGADPADLRKNLREATGQAFSLVKLDASADKPAPVFDQYFRKDEQDKIRARCGELMVILADVENDEGDFADAKKHLEMAKGLMPIDRLYHQKLAYYSLKSDPETSRREKALADKGQASTATEWFLIGDEYFKAKEFGKAADAFREALVLDPRHFWSQYFLATIALGRGEYGAAHSGFLVARSIQPDFPYCDVMLAVCEARMGDLEEADRHFQRAEAKVGQTNVFLVNRATVRAEQAQKLLAAKRDAEAKVLLEQAEVDLKKAGELAPSVEGLTSLGTVQQLLGNTAAAQRCLKQAVEAYPKAPAGTWKTWAQQLAKAAGQDPAALVEAANAYREAANREPDPKKVSEYALDAGNQFLQAGKLEEGAAQIQRALLSDPENPGAHLAMGNVQFVGGMKMPRNDAAGKKLLGEAAESFRRYLDLETSRKAEVKPQQALAWERLGTIQARQGDMVAALASQTQALALDPKTPSIRRMRGWNLMNQWRTAALSDFEEGLKENPAADDRIDLHLGRGYLLAQKGDVAGALSDLKQIEQLSKDKPMNLLNASTILAQVAGQQRKSKGPQSEDAKKTVEALSGLVVAAMEKIPAGSRASIWTRFKADEGFDPVRDMEGFQSLDKKFAPVGKP